MSLSDIYAALIDLALQWAIEGAMLVGGKLLSKGFKKLGSKLSKGGTKGASKVVRKSAKKTQQTFLQKTGSKIVSGIKKLSGATASDAYKEYLEKAAKVKGIKNALGMSDDELATFVRKTGGMSDELNTVAKNFTEGYDKYAKKYAKQVNATGKANTAFSDAMEEIGSLKRLDDSVGDSAAGFIVKNSTLKEALQSLDMVAVRLFDQQQVFKLSLAAQERKIVFAAIGALEIADTRIKHSRLPEVVEREVRRCQLFLEFRSRGYQLAQALRQDQRVIAQPQQVSFECFVVAHGPVVRCSRRHREFRKRSGAGRSCRQPARTMPRNPLDPKR
jgi:hypothetical protein